ncbi:LacI family DNA-binding transcriptional regulator [Paenibacillus athensensis]|uniref:Transcriptional regulator n=1 Tax=Paenibacillus athensensis TaxID=1967502 RepID=A0A4Y8PY86_9BACL|nr:LacI family DNA-binding transcriptional regulator [Paenibacillus athensensis]MCD1259891.1 LacI family DNA-binding transcriptional regulator [Paenibacillus athensensis]
MVTIKDIAEQAGVSFSTVSKALRGSSLVQESTKRHILAIAEQMGYQPNMAARSLVSKRTGAIGVLWPSIERAALTALLTGLNDKLEQEGYTTLLSISRMESAVAAFRRFQVDAMLVFGDKQLDPGLIDKRASIPVLAYGAAGGTSLPTVDVNRGQAIRLAVRHLVGLGHRAIAYVGRPHLDDPLQAAKIAAFREESAKLGLTLSDEAVAQRKGLDFHDGYLAARELLELPQRPTAVITGGIDLTRGVLRAFHELGVRVPQEMSVVSYDQLPQMDSLDVPMTATGVPVDVAAAAVAQALLALIEAPQSLATVDLEPQLVVRASTAGPRLAP